MTNLNDVMGKKFAVKDIIKRVNGVPVEIKQCVDVNTLANIVNMIAKSCFDEKGYRPEYREVARRFAILKYMTDIEVNEDNVEEIFRLTQGGNWYNEIEREVVHLPVWTEVEVAADKLIDYLFSIRETSFDKLCSDLSEIVTANKEADVAEVKEILDELNKVDKDAFVDKAIEKNLAKKKAGGSRGSKKS